MHDNDGGVNSNFVVQPLHGRQIAVYGDGGQNRSFWCVSALVAAVVRFMGLDLDPGPGSLGSPTAITIREVADRVVPMTSAGPRIQLNPRQSMTRCAAR